ncbi:hypothetical protein NE865_01735 [Phthorimaea operculella]|nr:hypothetical protein NE865_01735 [Phthorimaea operculella]
MSEPVPKQSKSCVEIGSLICAVIILIITTAAIIFTSVLLVIEVSYLYKDGAGGDPVLAQFVTIALSVAVFVSVVAFAFSIVFVIGVFKRKPGLVVAFFVFGVIMIALTLVGGMTIVCLFASEEFFTPRYIIPCVAGLIIYSAILWMIWNTHKKIKAANLYTPATSVHVDLSKKENEITFNYIDSKSKD